MNRTDFYRLFAKEYGVTIENAKETCCAVFDLLGRCVKETPRVYIKGLGTFNKRACKERRIGNLWGEGSVVIPAKEKIVFEPYNGSAEE